MSSCARWVACSWFLLHAFAEAHEPSTWAIADGLSSFNFSSDTHNVMNNDVWPMHCLLRAWYFTLSSMSGVGYGDMVPRTNLETGFQQLVVIVGASSAMTWAAIRRQPLMFIVCLYRCMSICSNHRLHRSAVKCGRWKK